MIVNTAIALYTSRLVLNVLGIEDYGIYNLIGGIIVLFSFMSTAMNNSTQRYLNTAMANGDDNRTRNIFYNSFLIFTCLAIFLFICIELGGYYLINNILTIPAARLPAANFILHFSALTFGLNIVRTPYNAIVIAYERMGFFAISSIAETVLKLVIVWMLLALGGDRLENYSELTLLVTALMLLAYFVYCNLTIRTAKLQGHYDGKIVKDLSAFTGWNLLGGVADVGYTQGTNIILNTFYGVSLNTAYGLANQIRNVVFSFVSNLQLAANPQIIQSFAQKDIGYYKTLIYSVSKYSFILMLLISLPLIINIDEVLAVWLVDVPDYTADFVSLIIIWALFDSLQGPLWVSMQAYGKIRNYQIVTSGILLLNLPLAYLVLYMGFPPQSIIIVQIAIKILMMGVRLRYSCKHAFLTYKEYGGKVLLPLTLLAVFSCIPSIYMAEITSGFLKFILTSLTSVILILGCSYFIVANSKERRMVKQWVNSKFNRIS